MNKLEHFRKELDEALIDLSLLHTQKHNSTGFDAIACSLGIIEKNRQIGYIKSQIERLEDELVTESNRINDAIVDKLNGVVALSLDDYQHKAKATDLYPPAVRFIALLDGLAEETGEVLGKHKKHLRGDETYKTEEQLKTALIKEIGDVLWYVAMLSDEMGVPLSEIAQANLDKLASRQERDVIKGDGDGR